TSDAPIATPSSPLDQDAPPGEDPRAPTFSARQAPLPVTDHGPPARYAEPLAPQDELADHHDRPSDQAAYDPPQDYRESAWPSPAQAPPAPGGQLAQVSQEVGDYLQRAPEGTYRVMPNDNFWTIAEKLYGSGNYFKALMQYNRQRYPVAEQLAVGDEVLAPSKAELVELYPDLCPKERRRATTFGVSSRPTTDGRIYVVQEGDTLFDIARYELGDPARWVEIYQLNAQQLTEDFNYVPPGTKLVMPGRPGRRPASQPERLTQQPEPGPPRR
ncbi:MAG: LysM peptidoglycan-binding domain-containing protein, partial [Planctomycetales bacterium]|nr:LysM peptidoglycan-binding domain-containing protein [Planctomycetales bacterium]